MPNIDGKAQDFINKVEQYLGFARSQIDSFNANHEQEARQVIAGRRQRVSRASSVPCSGSHRVMRAPRCRSTRTPCRRMSSGVPATSTSRARPSIAMTGTRVAGAAADALS